MSMEPIFIEALKEDPLDTTTRNAFADWLEENDRPEDAERQRKWVESYQFLVPFTAERYSQDYDENDDPIPGTDHPDFSEVMGEVEYWKQVVTGTDQYTQELCFSSEYAQDKLSDPEVRKKFWEAFYNVAGVDAPQQIKDQEWYRCSC